MRYTETREEKKAKLSATSGLAIAVVIIAVWIILIGFMFVFGLNVDTVPTYNHSFGTSQSPGEVVMTVVDPGNISSLILVGPDGTRSTVFSSGFQPGAEITLRSNATVHSYLENNSVRIPAEDGRFKIIDTPSDVTTAQLPLQEADLSDTNYTPRTAYLACLYEPHEGFELDGEPVPSNVSIPCHSPVLAQSDNIPTSTERDGNTITAPIILEEGEYSLVVRLYDSRHDILRENVVESIEVSEEIAGSTEEKT